MAKRIPPRSSRRTTRSSVVLEPHTASGRWLADAEEGKPIEPDLYAAVAAQARLDARRPSLPGIPLRSQRELLIEMVEIALTLGGCAFEGPVREGLESHLSQALDVLVEAT